jgi:hypothetical protein
MNVWRCAPRTSSCDARVSPMKRKLLRWAAGLVVAVVVLLVAVVLLRDLWLKPIAAWSIEEETGLRAVIGGISTSLGSGAVRVWDVRLYNPPEFGGALMADIPELAVEIAPGLASAGKLHFRNLKLVLTELNVVQNAAGRSNLDGVEKRVRERMHKRRLRKGEKFEFEFAGIDRMQITLRKVTYTDLKPPARIRTLDLAVNDEVVNSLMTEEELGRWAGGLVFRVSMQVMLAQLSPVEATNDPPVNPKASP